MQGYEGWRALVLATVLGLGTVVAGPAGVQPGPTIDTATGAAWWPQAQARAALLFVADPRSGQRLPGQAVALLRGLGFSVMLLDSRAMDRAPTEALDRVQQAWATLRQRHPGLPRVLAGQGWGATLATVTSDALEPAARPQLLWLLAPGRAAPRGWAATGPQDLLRPAAALARVDALCIGELERATRLLLVHGDRDTETDPAALQAWLDAAPEATVYRVKGAGAHDLLEAAEPRALLGRLLRGWLHALRRAERLRGAGQA